MEVESVINAYANRLERKMIAAVASPIGRMEHVPCYRFTFHKYCHFRGQARSQTGETAEMLPTRGLDRMFREFRGVCA